MSKAYWAARSPDKPLGPSEMRTLLQEEATRILRQASRAQLRGVPLSKGKLRRNPELALPAPRPGPEFAGEGRCCIYVISMPGPMIKIGKARNVSKRVADLQTGCPHDLWVLFTVEVEAALAPQIERESHAALHEHRLRGEWFKVSGPHAIAAVEGVIKRHVPDYEPAK